MNPPTEADLLSKPTPASSRTGHTLAIVAGWLLIGLFTVQSARLGRIGAGVRSYQLAWGFGAVGYILLVWVVMRAPSSASLGSWRLWLIGCAFLRVIPMGVEPTDDANRYLWEGRIQLAGFNPYVHAPDDPALAYLRDDTWKNINHPDYPAIYPPVAEVEFFAAAALHPSIHAIKALHVLWDAMVVGILGLCLRRLGHRPHLAVLYGLCPLVLSAFAVQGHIDSLMLLFVALCVWAVIENKTNVAGVALGLAIATKLIPIIFLPWFVFHRPRAAMVAVGVVVASYIPYLSAGTDLFSSLARFGGGNEFFSLLGTLGITNFETDAERVLVVAVLGAVVLLMGALIPRVHHFIASSTGALLMLMPVVHYWYFAWVLLVVPLTIRARWIAASLSMVAYFEAAHRLQTTGTWAMPDWTMKVVWGAWAAGVFADLLLSRRLRRRVQSHGADPQP